MPPTTQTGPRIYLDAATAADLMTANPSTLDANACVREAIMFLTDNGFSAAPVVDEDGKFVGVLSRSDIIIYDRGKVDYLPHVPDLGRQQNEPIFREGFQEENVDPTTIRDIMTPVVFTVAPTTPAGLVIEQMVERDVHRLFVVNYAGILTGVITTFDILKRLRPETDI
jgi:CBS domain-containing protein